MPDESPPAPQSRQRPHSHALVRSTAAPVDASMSVDRKPKPSLALTNSFHSIQLSLDAAARWAARDPIDHDELALALRCAREAADIAWRHLTEE